MKTLLRRDWIELAEWSRPLVDLRVLLLQLELGDVRTRALDAANSWGHVLRVQQENVGAQSERWSLARRNMLYAGMAVRARCRQEQREIDIKSYEEQARADPEPLTWEESSFLPVLRSLSYPFDKVSAIRSALERAATDLRRLCEAEHRIEQRIVNLERAFTALESEFRFKFPGESLRPIED